MRLPEIVQKSAPVAAPGLQDSFTRKEKRAYKVGEDSGFLRGSMLTLQAVSDVFGEAAADKLLNYIKRGAKGTPPPNVRSFVTRLMPMSNLVEKGSSTELGIYQAIVPPTGVYPPYSKVYVLMHSVPEPNGDLPLMTREWPDGTTQVIDHNDPGPHSYMSDDFIVRPAREGDDGFPEERDPQVVRDEVAADMKSAYERTLDVVDERIASSVYKIPIGVVDEEGFAQPHYLEDGVLTPLKSDG